jgi:hypothetical protein
LTASLFGIMLSFVRTTVTLDKDVERLLRDAMHRSRTSFKKTLNAAVRAGLGGKKTAHRKAHYAVRPKAMGLRAGIDPTGLNKLADEIEIEAFLEKQAGRRNR